jgi:hypothetical protein
MTNAKIQLAGRRLDLTPVVMRDATEYLQGLWDDLPDVPEGCPLTIPPGAYTIHAPLNWTGKIAHVSAYGVGIYPVGLTTGQMALTLGGASGQMVYDGTITGLKISGPFVDGVIPPHTNLQIQNSDGYILRDITLSLANTNLFFAGVGGTSYCTNIDVGIRRSTHARLHAACNADDTNWVSDLKIHGGTWKTGGGFLSGAEDTSTMFSFLGGAGGTKIRECTLQSDIGAKTIWGDFSWYVYWSGMYFETESDNAPGTIHYRSTCNEAVLIHNANRVSFTIVDDGANNILLPARD